jgi:hypothetical protein
MEKEKLFEIGNYTVWQISGQTTFFFKSGMTIDADGAPNAYHPDKNKGLDDLSNAGSEGHWWGIVTDNGQEDGEPVIQEDGPYRGYYISNTKFL